MLAYFGLSCTAQAETAQTQDIGSIPHCVTAHEQREVRGKSMQGLLQEGDHITVLRNYYDCRPVERGDWVVFRYVENQKQRSIVKIAMGLPGDKLGTQKADGMQVGIILINEKPLSSPEGMPYYVNDVGASYLGLALRQTRNSVIPRGRYWVLGTSYTDGWDSRRFGFIPHNDLLGKAIPSK